MRALFASPLGPLFRRWGGIPVNRRESTGFVGQMRAALEAHDDFRLVIAPEGTRSRTDHWKSGFWHLARFSMYYRRLFGEYPSETLRKSPRKTRTPS